MHTALIIGASGLVGKHLCHICIEHPSFTQVVALARRTLPIIDKDFRLIELADFSQLADISLSELGEVSGFCCLGSTKAKAQTKTNFRQVDFEYVLEFAKLCAKFNCEHFSVISSMGASLRSPFFYTRTKGEMEQAIKSLNLKSASIVRPSLLQGKRNESRTLESLAAPFMKNLPLSMRAIDGFAVAKAMVELTIQKTPGTHIYSSQDLHALATGS